MGIPTVAMELIDPHGLADRFIAEWRDPSPFVIARTSGSTGAPKEIRLPKADMEVSARATCSFFGIDSSSLLYMPLSADYIAGKMMIVRALVSGASLQIVTPSSDPLPLKPAGRVALLPVVPAQVAQLLSSPSLHLISDIIVGGAPLTDAQEDALRRCGAGVYATYGMTETCSHVALRSISCAQAWYEAMLGVEFSADSRGCLVIESSAYSWKRIVTNDVVRLLDSRRFIWLGRADNIINSGGVKMVPEEIERILAADLAGRPFYITSRPSDRWGEELVMVVEDLSLDSRAFLQYLRGRHPHRILPKAICTVASIPRTSSGKIIRKKM